MSRCKVPVLHFVTCYIIFELLVPPLQVYTRREQFFKVEFKEEQLQVQQIPLNQILTPSNKSVTLF